VEIAISPDPRERFQPPLCGPDFAYITSAEGAQGQKSSFPPSKLPKR
jgi:hypothetical protein